MRVCVRGRVDHPLHKSFPIPGSTQRYTRPRPVPSIQCYGSSALEGGQRLTAASYCRSESSVVLMQKLKCTVNLPLIII